MKITLHLLEDDRPNGPRVAKIDQWSGRAMGVPRSDLDSLHVRRELAGPCLYFLVAQTGAAAAPRVYVGEADGFLDRLRSHDQRKDWWSSLVVFYSADGSLTKSGIQYLESRCIAKLREAGWCKLDNGVSPGLPTVPEEDIGGLDQFLRNVAVLMPVLGYNLFEPAPAEGTENEDQPDEPSSMRGRRDFDTIVCPCRQSAFEFAFLGQHAWWAIRIREENIPLIRYIAMYRIKPTSAITHYGAVKSIELYIGADKPAGKYKVNIAGDPIELPKPIGFGTNAHLKPQGPKYALLADIIKAKTLDDVFG